MKVGDTTVTVKLDTEHLEQIIGAIEELRRRIDWLAENPHPRIHPWEEHKPLLGPSGE